MNKIIEITIRNKVARIASSPIIVGKNKDYIVRFDFDEDWDKYDTKTARFSQDDEYQDIIFAGNECSMPALDGGKVVEVGVYAGDISTTTPAYLKVQKSIIDDDGVPAEPQPDVYAQLMERLNELEAPAAVLYTGQELTEAQKAQARENIGVAQSDWEQTDETAADYLKNRPFGNVAYDGIFFKRVPGGYNLVRVPGFNALANIQGSRQAEIRRGGNVVNTGSASVSVSDLDGSISIIYISTAGTIINFGGSSGYLTGINVQNNTGITLESEYVLHIDGLYYEQYIKLSADKVEGTLPSASAADCALISTGSGNNWSVTKISTDFPLASATGRGAVKVGDGLSISSDGKLSVDMSGLDTKSLGISGASVGQTVKIKAVGENGAPTEWEAADLPSGEVKLIASCTLEETASAIEFTGLSVKNKSLSIRIKNTGNSCGNGWQIWVNGALRDGSTGSTGSTSTYLANNRIWLFPDGSTLRGISQCSNGGINHYNWTNFQGTITSIKLTSAYHSDTSKYYGIGTNVEVYEGILPNIQ